MTVVNNGKSNNFRPGIDGSTARRVAELGREVTDLTRIVRELQDRNSQLVIGALTFGDLAERLNARLLADRSRPASLIVEPDSG